MKIIDLSQFKNQELEFKYFDIYGREIDMNKFTK